MVILPKQSWNVYIKLLKHLRRRSCSFASLIAKIRLIKHNKELTTIALDNGKTWAETNFFNTTRNPIGKYESLFLQR